MSSSIVRNQKRTGILDMNEKEQTGSDIIRHWTKITIPSSRERITAAILVVK